MVQKARFDPKWQAIGQKKLERKKVDGASNKEAVKHVTKLFV
ncbi:hypothetical protein [Enterococcus gilvus]|jgi:hypothetical protein|nr:hypothetical protein [Enterococcus gilvus]OJG40929.1 hypothetical protein RV02_GL001392 [Enterococcus gilvus]